MAPYGHRSPIPWGKCAKLRYSNKGASPDRGPNPTTVLKSNTQTRRAILHQCIRNRDALCGHFYPMSGLVVKHFLHPPDFSEKTSYLYRGLASSEPDVS